MHFVLNVAAVIYIGERGTIFERRTSTYKNRRMMTAEAATALGKNMGETVLASNTQREGQWQFENGEFTRISQKENLINRLVIAFGRDGARLTRQLTIKPALVISRRKQTIVHSSVIGTAFEVLSTN
jgi:hypothetical protein